MISCDSRTASASSMVSRRRGEQSQYRCGSGEPSPRCREDAAGRAQSDADVGRHGSWAAHKDGPGKDERCQDTYNRPRRGLERYAAARYAIAMRITAKAMQRHQRGRSAEGARQKGGKWEVEKLQRLHLHDERLEDLPAAAFIDVSHQIRRDTAAAHAFRSGWSVVVSQSTSRPLVSAWIILMDTYLRPSLQSRPRQVSLRRRRLRTRRRASCDGRVGRPSDISDLS